MPDPFSPKPASDAAGSGEVLLRANAVSRSFGGLKAVDAVSLAVRRGTVHAVIGTN
ncbi:MAG: hypothetical protein H3C59_13785, partial [Burkholderiaceae bacterium]|nr:hypothetical protein [Burkholderiaceae bacterium]